jgi:hypothetical protein
MKARISIADCITELRLRWHQKRRACARSASAYVRHTLQVMRLEVHRNPHAAAAFDHVIGDDARLTHSSRSIP